MRGKRRVVQNNSAVSNAVFNICNNAFLVLFAFVCVYPFYYLIINSISSNTLSANGEILFWPREIHFSNYVQVFKLPGLMQAVIISVSRTVIGTILTVSVSAFLGFMFTHEKMWGRRFWYRFMVVTMYFSAGLIPWYLTVMKLGLLNNFLVYVLPGIVNPFNVILAKTYVESTPKALQESAEIDGAGVMTIFLRIILPLTKPILATLAIFSAVGQWNSFMDTVLLMTDQKLFTLQFVLYQYLSQASSLAKMIQSGGITDAAIDAATKQTATSVRMTISIIVTLPILFVYPFCQRYFVQGIMMGAVKG